MHVVYICSIYACSIVILSRRILSPHAALVDLITSIFSPLLELKNTMAITNSCLWLSILTKWYWWASKLAPTTPEYKDHVCGNFYDDL